ncbi:DUF881 domain-containing protein [Senegalia sp. (in: firmicutes)]|uniref:DUF881 domain-containing protein n=1 Tax=Senegalia sp. (in: firmicutes) TaxID=1924098 RepID=UPI003F943811
MKNLVSKSLIVTVCVILGIIIAIQYKTVNSLVGPDFVPSQKNKELVNQVSKVEEEKEALMNELTNLENKVQKYESEVSEESDYVKELSKELSKYKMFAGYTEVEGEGVEIIINNPDSDDAYGYPISIVEDYEYLLDTISYLNVTGAEAISINDLRYTSFTEMLMAGDHLNINNKPIGSPIIIKAIGPADDFKAALEMNRGIVDLLQSYGYKVEINKKENVKIPRYTEIKEFKYAEPISEE